MLSNTLQIYQYLQMIYVREWIESDVTKLYIDKEREKIM